MSRGKRPGNEENHADFRRKPEKTGVPAVKNCLVKLLTPEQMEFLKTILEAEGWLVGEAPYCHFKAEKNRTSLAAYCSGKLVVQGRGAGDFVEFLLEPRVTGCTAETPEKNSSAEAVFSPHAGIDESGKGDFFGPLAVACVFVPDQETAAQLAHLGVKDSKLIKNDGVITRLAASLLRAVKGKAAVVAIGPEAYNRLYRSFGNLNRLLAWGHARALENLLEKAPECHAVLADKFGHESLIRHALLDAGRKVTLTQRTKAENDIAVAAASILARAEFVRRLISLGENAGVTLPKGAGASVDAAAAALVQSGGKALLERVAKMHFRNAARALDKLPL